MKIVADEDAEIVDLLMARFPGATRTGVRKWIKHGAVCLDGQPVLRAETLVRAGQRIEYRKTAAPRSGPAAPVPIVFEDRYLLVADKPAGMLTHGPRGAVGTSLYALLKGWVQTRGAGGPELRVVHRLDREVSGLVVFAFGTQMQEKLKADWKQVTKRYTALVEGRLPAKNGTVNTFLKEGAGKRMIVTADPVGAKQAVTRYRVQRQIGPYILAEIELETGRKNQIRVHLAHLGCPVVGDRRYGADASVVRRIRLHAHQLELTHPATGVRLRWTSPLPPNFLTPSDRDERYK